MKILANSAIPFFRVSDLLFRTVFEIRYVYILTKFISLPKIY